MAVFMMSVYILAQNIYKSYTHYYTLDVFIAIRPLGPIKNECIVLIVCKGSFVTGRYLTLDTSFMIAVVQN